MDVDTLDKGMPIRQTSRNNHGIDINGSAMRSSERAGVENGVIEGGGLEPIS